MSAMSKAIALAVIQVLLVSSLGAKLLYDRHTRPQVWFRSMQYDPSLPIRGRYLAQQLEVNDPLTPDEIHKKFDLIPDFGSFGRECGSIEIRNNQPTAVFENHADNRVFYDCDNLAFSRWSRGNAGYSLRIDEPVLFFIPDTAKDAVHMARGDELWVLATIPKKGPPRPIALAIKKQGETELHPLDLH